MVARGRNTAVPSRTLHVGGYPVVTTVTARPGVVRRWLYTTMWRQRQNLHSAAGLTVGLGVQWTPPFRKLPGGAEPRPGTLQLCAGNRCLIYQIARAGGVVPKILRRFLADARITFAVYGVASDCRKLRAHHGLELGSTLELQGAAGMGNASMAEMADRLLGIRGGVEKSRRIGTSTWDGAKLSRGQVRYACVDAFLSHCLGDHIRLYMASDDEYESDPDDDIDSMDGEESEPDAVDGGYWG